MLLCQQQTKSEIMINKSKRLRVTKYKDIINPSHNTGLFRYLLKTSENIWLSDVFRGYRKRPVARNGLIMALEKITHSETTQTSKRDLLRK